MVVALRPGRRGAGRDEVAERQSLEPGTAGAGWGRAAAQMQAAQGGNGGGEEFQGNGGIRGGDKEGHSQH